MKRVVINIFGRVQKVGFRFSTLQKARELNIKGYVKNLRDGSVQIEAEGKESNINEFVEWSKIGPPYSDIKKIIVEDMEVLNEDTDFEVI